MLIGIEAERANIGQKTGVENYARQLIIHLAAIDAKNDYILYLRTKPQDWLLSLPPNFRIKIMPFPVFWTQLRISWEMLFHPVDVLFIPASAMPFIHPRRSVATIHDLAWDFFPETYTAFILYYSKFVTWFVAKFSSRLIAVSQSTKEDLMKKYKIAADKINVIYHGYELAAHAGMALAPSGLPERYVLFLSTLQPRKNLEGLIRAFRLLKQERPELPQKLVVVGKPGWKFENIVKAINDNKDIVVYLNHVSEADKAAILSGADVLVLPSFYEGFGMQILEAFAAGVPVAVSNISSLPEVAADAAVYFDPNNDAEIKNAMLHILLDKSLADSLREKGARRLKNFSWEKCARETLEVLTMIK
ncbi:MAG: glycosyltransferase family 1 protein [Candidatus Doudnabacteria bacterium]|nr:glycosyltransferase family 1 protein [Candidatus Doudnabacteria bacterium]